MANLALFRNQNRPPGTSSKTVKTRQLLDCDYFAVTALVAEPPKLLLTLMFEGFEGQENCPSYFPPPLFVNVPMRAPGAVTYTLRVALALVLLAWTSS